MIKSSAFLALVIMKLSASCSVCQVLLVYIFARNVTSPNPRHSKVLNVELKLLKNAL